MSLRDWFMEVRPGFLLLTPLNYSVGIAAAYVEGYFNPFNALIGAVGVLFAHLAINVINEYFDYKSGLDFKTYKTPFSGGSGVITAGSLKPRSVYLFAVTCLFLGGTIGLYFSYTIGWGLLPLVLLAAFIIYTYTTHLSHMYIGELSTGLAYGFMMAVGAYFIMTGRYSVSAYIPGVIPGILGFALLYINEFPDVEPDREVGRRNLVMLLGIRKASRVYALIVSSLYGWILLCIWLGYMDVTMLIVLLSAPIGYKAAKGAMVNYGDIDKLVPSLAANVQWILLSTLLTIIGLLASAWV